MPSVGLYEWVTRPFPQTFTHIVAGDFVNPQFASQGAMGFVLLRPCSWDRTLLRYRKNGQLDNGVNVIDGPLEFGEIHTFDQRWSLIGHIGGRQLLFYDASSRVAEVHRVETDGGLTLQQRHVGMLPTWLHMVPGQFGSSQVLLYDEGAGYGEFHHIDAAGNMSLVASHHWATGWDLIVRGNFSNSANDDLLFYRRSGAGEFYRVNDNGGTSLLADHENWRTTWAQIVPGQYVETETYDGLLFYDGGSTTGIATTDGHGGLQDLATLFGAPWASPWQTVIAGTFIGNIAPVATSDLVAYSKEFGLIRYFHVVPAAIATVTDLRGIWTDGGSAFPVISESGTDLSIDMSSQHRPTAHGSVIDSQTITVTFADDATFTGTLHAPGDDRLVQQLVVDKGHGHRPARDLDGRRVRLPRDLGERDRPQHRHVQSAPSDGSRLGHRQPDDHRHLRRRRHLHRHAARPRDDRLVQQLVVDKDRSPRRQLRPRPLRREGRRDTRQSLMTR